MRSEDAMVPLTPEDYFATESVGPDTFERVRAAVTSTHPDVTVHVSKSQIAFRRRRGFAYLWIPGQYLRRPVTPVVRSIATRHRLRSERFKEVVRPGPWMHHLEIFDAADVDDNVIGWLSIAAHDAGPPAAGRE
jgi:hypothetical protein